MSVLDRKELEQSPLADLHTIASEFGLEGFRRMRKDDLIRAIIAASGGEAEPKELPDRDRAAEADQEEAAADHAEGGMSPRPVRPGPARPPESAPGPETASAVGIPPVHRFFPFSRFFAGGRRGRRYNILPLNN